MRDLIQSLLFIGVFLAISVSASAQDAVNEPEEVVNLSSPYQTIYNHLSNLQPDSYYPDLAAQSLYAPKLSLEKRKALSVKLKQIMDGKGKYVDLNLLPENPDYRDTTRGRSVYVLFEDYPQIYVEKIKGKWYYSRTTVSSIPELHEEVYPWGSDLLLNLLPEFGHRIFLGLKVWQWLGVLLLILLAVIVHFLLKWFLSLVLVKVVASRLRKLEDPRRTFYKVSRVLSLLLTTWLMMYLVPLLLLPIRISQGFIVTLTIFLSVFAVFLMLRVIDVVFVYLKLTAEKTESNMDDQLLPIVKKIVKTLAIIAGVIYILKTLSVNITALIAGISIGGLALALAAQDTVKHFIGSVMIFFDRPFQIGDWINFDGNDGTVEEVGVRSTRIRTFSNSILSVPNGRLVDMTINNMGLRIYRRYKTTVGVTYDTPPELIEAFIKGIRDIMAQHPSTKKDNFEVTLESFGDFSLNIMIYVFFAVPDWSSELKAKQEIMLAIITLAHKLGVQFAFPTSTLHIENLPGQVSNSPNYDKDPASIKEKLAQFSSGVNDIWEKA